MILAVLSLFITQLWYGVLEKIYTGMNLIDSKEYNQVHKNYNIQYSINLPIDCVVFLIVLSLMFLSPQLIYPLKEVSLSCSILMMVTLATERVIALYKPLSRFLRHLSTTDWQESWSSLGLEIEVYKTLGLVWNSKPLLVMVSIWNLSLILAWCYSLVLVLPRI